MIEELSIRNFALVDSLTLSLDSGFSVLTGETGAGKSIIAGALSFLLGSKADTEVIRSGCAEAQVSAVVLIGGENRDAAGWLTQRDIETDDSRITVRRTVKSSGRSSIYIQDAPVTRNDLLEFMGFLFDLHGQHTHESLLRKETHRVYLDRFAGLEEEASAFNKVYIELSGKRKALEASFSSERDREARLEILGYAVEEISQAGLKSGEIKELEAETQRLGDFEKLSLHVDTAASAMFDDEVSLLSLGRRSMSAIGGAASIDPSLEPLQKRFEDLYYETEDLASEFRRYRDGLNYDPGRLEEAEERLSLLYRLKKKYRPVHAGAGLPAEEAILAYKAEAEAEIAAFAGAGENREKLKAGISLLEKDLAARASALSAKRGEGAKRLGKGITEILSRLGMPNAVFAAQVGPRTVSGGKDAVGGAYSGANDGAETAPEKPGLACGPWGADNVEFMISANAGEPLKELARIASGGELSRVMLAIKTILCGTDMPGQDAAADASAETLVFDEVDTGIGGEVALAVGEYLARIGKTKQIFCVTHLASIAVRADNHLKVEKKVIAGEAGAGRTVTGVSLLSAGERRQEIARMLSGDSGSAALAHADDLLAKYGIHR